MPYRNSLPAGQNSFGEASDLWDSSDDESLSWLSSSLRAGLSSEDDKGVLSSRCCQYTSTLDYYCQISGGEKIRRKRRSMVCWSGRGDSNDSPVKEGFDGEANSLTRTFPRSSISLVPEWKSASPARRSVFPVAISTCPRQRINAPSLSWCSALIARMEADEGGPRHRG